MPAIRYVSRALVLLALFASAGLLSAQSAEAVAFSPTAFVCLDNSTTIDTDAFNEGQPQECDGDSTPGTGSGVTFNYRLDSPDVVHEELIFFAPPDWVIPSDGDVANGTQMGVTIARSNLAVGQVGSCGIDAIIAFTMRDATTDQSNLVTFDQQDDPGGAFPRGVNEYPEYLQTTWTADPDNSTTALQPLARYFGRPNVPFLFQISINVGIFAPGTTYRGQTLASELGYPIVVTPQITGHYDEHPEPRPITGECTPYAFAMTIANGAWSNPPFASAHSFTTFTSSQRDADGDSHENGLDSCPYLPNPGWNPRDPTGIPLQGDEDGDGIPDDCDPLPNDSGNPAGGALGDHDGDAYPNQQDNCPLITNGVGDADDQGDADYDDIGDACDLSPTVPDGEQTTRCHVTVVQIGTGGSQAEDPSILSPCSGVVTFVCTGCEDADSDGVLDPFDNCPDTPNPGQADFDDDGVGDACAPVGGIVDVVSESRSQGSLLALVVVLALIAAISLPQRT